MPARPRSYAAVVKAAERALRAARVDHVFVGGLAVMAFGEPRTTLDVDVIASYRRAGVAPAGAGVRPPGVFPPPPGLPGSPSPRAPSTTPPPPSPHPLALSPAVPRAA